MARTPFTPTPFARRLTAHMCAWRRGQDGSSHPILPTWSYGIHPDFREAAIAAVAEDEVRLHNFTAAVTSSQVFALNLFIPWRAGPRAALVLEGIVDRAWFLLFAHDDNPDVAEHWVAWRSLLPDSSTAPVLRASAVVAARPADGHSSWAEWMTMRYRLPSS